MKKVLKIRGKWHGHVHKYEAAFGCGVDILMAVTFLSIVLFQKQNQKIISVNH